MAIPNNITKEHLLNAIKKIDVEGIPSDGASQYYDLIYEGNQYPPKLVVSYANLFANGTILDRNSFDGGKGTPCFNLLEDLGFKISEKTLKTKTNRKIWFVTQSSTFTSDRGMKFLWAPTKAKDDKPRHYWTNVSMVKKGDIIFNYSSKALRGVSIALNDGYSSKNDADISTWNKEGIRVDIDLFLLHPAVPMSTFVHHKDVILSLLSNVLYKPFTKTGKVNQGYLFEFSAEAGKFIREVYGKKFGIPEIDDFFDQVELGNGNKFMNNNTNNNNNNNNNNNINPHILQKQFTEAGLYFNETLINRFIGSLLAKKFLILTGLSGSGKTKLAQAFVHWICINQSQFKLVPVGADWTNRDPLLGYPNALKSGEYIKPESGVLDLIIHANINPELPHFLILDEMNLSHVERYFADFLSVMESNEDISLCAEGAVENGVPAKLKIPSNLFIIGTVNIDETTYMFSPKVLDRANTIEFRVTQDEIKNFLGNIKTINMDALVGKGAGMAKSFLEMSANMSFATEDIETINAALVRFFGELKKTGAEFGYRSATEILRLIHQLTVLDSNITTNQKIDIAIMQKLLPKLHGSRRKLCPVLETLGSFCISNNTKIIKDVFEKPDFDFNDENVFYPISLEKIARMYRRAIDNGFASFAEA